MSKKIALLDAGAQAEKVIMRRVLEQGYDVDKFPVDVSPSAIKDYDGIIISGGPRSVNDSDSLLPDSGVYRLGKPILGICYGMQAIAHQLGGNVAKGKKGQYGRNFVDFSKNEDLFERLSSRERVLMSHFDTVQRAPYGFEIYGTSQGMIAAIGNKSKKIYGVQFHPELIPVTKNGDKIFENFFRNVCKFPAAEKRSIEQDIEHAEKAIIDAVGSDKHVMHYQSWGVDSTVMAMLLRKCMEPERLHIRTLDTGTMRIGEIEEAYEMARKLELKFKVLNVRNNFYNASSEIETRAGKVFAGPLCHTIDPEYKRKLFGTEYAEIAVREMEKISNEINVPLDQFLLGQGTLRPDVIESGDSRVTGEGHTIKTHHNAVERLKDITKVEPLIELFKDQVREIAMKLGLPEEFAYRQPFPGPGLYCRIIGHKGNQVIDDDFLKIDKRVHDEAKKYGFEAHVLPIRTVGVQGDERSYKHPVIVSGDVGWEEFTKLALELPNEVREINRVIYTPGKPLTLEESLSITPTYMTSNVIKQTQEADLIMRNIAEQYGYNDSRKCSQMPGITIPCGFGKEKHRSFVIRPTWTHDFMSIIGMMPYVGHSPEENSEEFFNEEMFYDMAKEIPEKVEGISRVILDASDKPPASTEWE